MVVPKTRPRVLFRDLFQDDTPPGKASEYITSIKLLVKNGQINNVVLWCRVSAHGAQKRRENVRDQEKFLRRISKELGLTVIACFRCTESGWDLDNPVLAGAIRYARLNDAVLLAESTDRFLRSRDYKTEKNFNNAIPTVAQLAELSRQAAGVTLATYLDPDASPKEVRSFQRKRSQWAKGNKGGRPPKKIPGLKKLIRETLLPRALELLHARFTYREISAELNISVSTLQGWFRMEGQPCTVFAG